MLYLNIMQKSKTFHKVFCKIIKCGIPNSLGNVVFMIPFPWNFSRKISGNLHLGVCNWIYTSRAQMWLQKFLIIFHSMTLKVPVTMILIWLLRKVFLHNERLFRGKLLMPRTTLELSRRPMKAMALASSNSSRKSNENSAPAWHHGTGSIYRKNLSLIWSVFCKRERRRKTEWLQETKTADQWGTTKLKNFF